MTAFLPEDPDELVNKQRITRLADWMLDYWWKTLLVHGTGRGYVYAVQAVSGGPVKIGMTYAPLRRLAGLQDGSPARLVIRAVMLGWSVTERRIHDRWAGHRLNGEWFDEAAAPPLIAFVRGAGIAQVIEFRAGETNTSFLANTLPFGRPQ